MADYRVLGVLKLVFASCLVGLNSKAAGLGSKIFQCYCWPAGERGQGPGHPGACVDLLMGGLGPRASAGPLVGRVESWGLSSV